MTPACRIRAARSPDHSRLRTIQRDSIPEPSPKLLASALEGPLTALVRVDGDGSIVGYVLAVVSEESCYVPEIAVIPDRQNQGHGSALLDAIYQECRDRDGTRVRLTARATDRRVRDFYENRGFTQVDRVSAHYDSGADGVVYERDIT